MADASGKPKTVLLQVFYNVGKDYQKGNMSVTKMTASEILELKKTKKLTLFERLVLREKQLLALKNPEYYPSAEFWKDRLSPEEMSRKYPIESLLELNAKTEFYRKPPTNQAPVKLDPLENKLFQKSLKSLKTKKHFYPPAHLLVKFMDFTTQKQEEDFCNDPEEWSREYPRDAFACIISQPAFQGWLAEMKVKLFSVK